MNSNPYYDRLKGKQGTINAFLKKGKTGCIMETGEHVGFSPKYYDIICTCTGKAASVTSAWEELSDYQSGVGWLGEQRDNGFIPSGFLFQGIQTVNSENGCPCKRWSHKDVYVLFGARDQSIFFKLHFSFGYYPEYTKCAKTKKCFDLCTTCCYCRCRTSTIRVKYQTIEVLGSTWKERIPKRIISRRTSGRLNPVGLRSAISM